VLWPAGRQGENSQGEFRAGGGTFGSSVQFLLTDGSGMSPDAAWVLKERLAVPSKGELRQFPRVAPGFVIEIVSPSDRLAAAQPKMRLRAANAWSWGGPSGAITGAFYALPRAFEV